jgi:hypothetical protein
VVLEVHIFAIPEADLYYVGVLGITHEGGALALCSCERASATKGGGGNIDREEGKGGWRGLSSQAWETFSSKDAKRRFLISAVISA